MSDLIGLISIIFLIFMTMLAAVHWSSISKILYIALILRVTLLLSGHYFINLPDSNSDSIRFELNAWILASDGFYNVLNNFNGPSSDFISWIIAIPYSLFGRSLLMAQSMSVFFGMICIILVWKLSRILWNDNIANKSAWIIAIFPSMVLYSVLLMREIYVCFFLIIGLYGLVTWLKTYKLKSIALILVGFLGGTFFHGAIIFGLSTLLIIFITTTLIKFFQLILKLKTSYKVLIHLTLLTAIFFVLMLNIIYIPKLGKIENLTKIQYNLNNLKKAYRGDASLPAWTKINYPHELLYKGPVKSIYFIFSPFPWDIKKKYHIIGLLDSFLYLWLSVLILKNIKTIWRDPVLRILLILLASYIFIFGISMGNFGTGIRHRLKFVIMFILLAAPFLPRIIFFKKN